MDNESLGVPQVPLHTDVRLCGGNSHVRTQDLVGEGFLDQRRSDEDQLDKAFRHKYGGYNEILVKTSQRPQHPKHLQHPPKR